jgi:hypothetical protein
VAVPAEGAAAEVIYLTVTKPGLPSSTYTIIVKPAPTTSATDKSLMYFNVFYENDTEGQISFNKDTTDYTVNVPADRNQSRISVGHIYTSSSAANYAVAWGTADESAQTLDPKTAPVAVPRTGEAAKKFFVTVTAGNGDLQRYIVTVNPYTPAAQTKTWSGTVVAPNSGGKTAVQVLARGADIKVTHSAEVDSLGGWTLAAPQSFTPESFIVTFSASDGAYRSKAYTPTVVAGTPIVLNVNYGTDVGKAVLSAKDLAGMSASTSYSLADDIDLNNTTVFPSGWDGPDSYAGQFYGNGYTVKLTLKKTWGDTGLFDTLNGGAGIHDLVVDVASPAGGLVMTGASHFGGVVGEVKNSSGSIVLENVKVKGELVYTALPGADISYLVVGGFIGEVSETSAPPVEFRNCVSELNITENITVQVPSNFFGGFIGRGDRTLTFTNCYATGNIALSVAKSSNPQAGGFIGVSYGPSVTIENCYSAGTISYTITDSAQTTAMNIGGFVGSFDISATTTYIKNSAALNTSVSAVSAKTINIGRVMGGGQEGRLSGNFALDGMAVKVNNATQTISGGLATNKNGLAKTAAEFKTTTPWTALSFSTAIWDFGTIPTLGRPTLK